MSRPGDRPSGRPAARRAPPRGIALLIVVSVLTVMLIMGVSFVFSMHLETQVSRHFASTAQARYIAEAGVNHARALLDEDRLASRTDDLGEAWTTQLAGHDTDVDGDGQPDAVWWPVMPAAQPGAEQVNPNEPIGHYAALVHDETGKINLNTALADPDAAHVDAPNLTAILTRCQVANAKAAAEAIEAYRYGPDGRPGVAQVDDDDDGTVDEPDEYQSMQLRGDDRRFESVMEVLGLGGLDKAAVKRLSKVVTAYSWDPNVSVTGKARINVNTADADELLQMLIESGVANPWQMAANMADYADPDLAISHVTKTAARVAIASQGDLGDWHWRLEGTNGYYETDRTDGEPLIWRAAVPTAAKAHVLVRGVDGVKVGDVTIAGQTRPSLDAGESFGQLDVSAALDVEVACHEPIGARCAFSGIELVASEPTAGFSTVLVRGIEPIRINEIMASPTLELSAGAAQFSGQTSGWTCQNGSCFNSGTGQGHWTWINPALRPGAYYVRVYGRSAGDTVGETRLSTGSRSVLLTHGERHPEVAQVGEDHEVSVTLGKTAADGTYYFGKLSLSVEPDAEYVELINLSDQPVNVSGWTLEGDVVQGRQAKLPAGSTIAPHGLLVAAVDADDSQQGLDGNGISARGAWEIPAEAAVVQLEFPGGGLSPDMDWLSTHAPSGTAPGLILRSGELTVDEVELPTPLPTTTAFQSLEKGDPTVVRDDDGDGLDDGWYPSLRLFTPGAPNDNNGLRDVQGQQIITHDPLTEITVLNRPLASVGELAGLPSGIAWRAVATDDLAKFVDRITVRGMQLEAEGHLTEGEDQWRETPDGHQASRAQAVGTWRWLAVPDGQYRLSAYGWSGEQLSLRWQTAPDTYGEWMPTRTADAQGRITAGQVSVGLNGAPVGMFTLQVRCESPSEVCHLLHIRLDPQLAVEGLVNINTAPLDVLLSLPGMTDVIAQRLIAGRPYGDKDQKARGIGDLLVGSVLGEAEEDKLARFRRLGGLVTIRSKVFQIISVGESLEHDRPSASQRIQAIVER